MGLGAKGTAGQPLVRAFGHEADQDFLGLLQIGQEQALELAAPVRVVRQVPELLERQRQMTFTDLLPHRLRTAEKARRQVLNLSGAEFFTPQSGDELVDGRGAV